MEDQSKTLEKDQSGKPSTSTFQGKTFIITPDKIASMGLIEQIKTIFNTQVAPKISHNSQFVKQNNKKANAGQKNLQKLSRNKSDRSLQGQDTDNQAEIQCLDEEVDSSNNSNIQENLNLEKHCKDKHLNVPDVCSETITSDETQNQRLERENNDVSISTVICNSTKAKDNTDVELVLDETPTTEETEKTVTSTKVHSPHLIISDTGGSVVESKLVEIDNEKIFNDTKLAAGKRRPRLTQVALKNSDTRVKSSSLTQKDVSSHVPNEFSDVSEDSRKNVDEGPQINSNNDELLLIPNIENIHNISATEMEGVAIIESDCNLKPAKVSASEKDSTITPKLSTPLDLVMKDPVDDIKLPVAITEDNAKLPIATAEVPSTKIHLLSVEPVFLPETDLKQITKFVVKDKNVKRLSQNSGNKDSQVLKSALINISATETTIKHSEPKPSCSKPEFAHETIKIADQIEPVVINQTETEAVFTTPKRRTYRKHKSEAEKLRIKDSETPVVLETKRIRKRKCESEFITDEEYESAIEMAESMPYSSKPIVKSFSNDVKKRRGRRKVKEANLTDSQSNPNLTDDAGNITNLLDITQTSMTDSQKPDLLSISNATVKQELDAGTIVAILSPRPSLDTDFLSEFIVYNPVKQQIKEDISTLDEFEVLVKEEPQTCLTDSGSSSFHTHQENA